MLCQGGPQVHDYMCTVMKGVGGVLDMIPFDYRIEFSNRESVSVFVNNLSRISPVLSLIASKFIHGACNSCPQMGPYGPFEPADQPSPVLV